MESQKAYIIPIAEILSCLNEVGIKVKAEDLVQPEEKKETVKRVFEQLAEKCLGISRDEMSQATFAGLQAMSYPELHEESIPQMNCFRILQQLFERYGIKDFSLNDITNPTPRRLRIQLSYAVNFLKYREERLAALAEYDNQRVTLNNQLSRAQSHREDMERTVAVKQQKMDEQAEVVSRMEAEAKEMESKISQLNVRQAEIREGSSVMKNHNNELKDRLASKKLQLEELLVLKKQLQGQIVSSPEKLKKQLDDTNASLRSQHTEIRACEKKHKELNAWIECVSNATHDLGLAKDAVDGLSVELSNNKVASNNIASKEQQLAANKDVLKALQQNTVQLSRKVARHEEKNNTLKQGAEARAIDATTTMDRLQRDIIAATNLKSDVRAKVEALDNEVQTMKKLVESERSVQEQEIEDIKESYHRMEAVVINHLKSLRSAVTTKGGADVSASATAAANSTSNSLVVDNMENLPPPPMPAATSFAV